MLTMGTFNTLEDGTATSDVKVCEAREEREERSLLLHRLVRGSPFSFPSWEEILRVSNGWAVGGPWTILPTSLSVIHPLKSNERNKAIPSGNIYTHSIFIDYLLPLEVTSGCHLVAEPRSSSLFASTKPYKAWDSGYLKDCPIPYIPNHCAVQKRGSYEYHLICSISYRN